VVISVYKPHVQNEAKASPLKIGDDDDGDAVEERRTWVAFYEGKDSGPDAARVITESLLKWKAGPDRRSRTQ